jgi:energy-coupling factor transporter ATP-binding protein EcfA2
MTRNGGGRCGRSSVNTQRCSAVFGNREQVAASASTIAQAFSGLDDRDQAIPQAELDLAADLLLKIAGIGPDHFADLLRAVSEGRDGYVNGIQEQINKALALHLNFRRWWTQDSSFQLRASVRELDLALIIRDRTGTDYSFRERSGGLKYFLSYFVQYLAHDAPATGSEILLMDEPDVYLSSQGQRDLLRVFDALARPEDDRRPCPVVYVTHSPFLMDKNHAERIRVLEKGAGDEGTRVVRDAAQNHYEPLRSAFGGFVAETTFMGTCNLMIEGPADQILLCRGFDVAAPAQHPRDGASRSQRSDSRPGERRVYLARGRDVEKPAVIVLLDGDQAGADARKAIRRGGAYRKPLVDDDLVVQLTDDEFRFTTARKGGVVDIEDLVPVDVAVAAAERYAQEFLVGQDGAVSLSVADVDPSDGVLQGVEEALRQAISDPDVTLDKVGFARHVLAVIAAPLASPTPVGTSAIEELESNFRSLFAVIGRLQRRAMSELANIKVSDKVSRVISAFRDDHAIKATKAEVEILFEQIGYGLDTSRESEDIRSEMRRLTDIHQLQVDSRVPMC